MEMGGLDQFFFSMVAINNTSALRLYSVSPGNLRSLQTNTIRAMQLMRMKETDDDKAMAIHNRTRHSMHVTSMWCCTFVAVMTIGLSCHVFLSIYILPYDGISLWRVSGPASSSRDVGFGSIFGAWNHHLHVAAKHLSTEVGFDGHLDFHSGASNFLDDGHDTEREIDIFGGSVFHELEFSVWWDERDGSVGVPLAQLHALVESAVVKFDATWFPVMMA